MSERERAHQLIDRLPDPQLSALVGLLETIVNPAATALRNASEEDEEIGPEEEAAVARSKAWFQHNEGTPFEQVVAELGFSMDQVRNSKDPAD
jgi:hypothetical protein